MNWLVMMPWNMTFWRFHCSFLDLFLHRRWNRSTWILIDLIFTIFISCFLVFSKSLRFGFLKAIVIEETEILGFWIRDIVFLEVIFFNGVDWPKDGENWQIDIRKNFWFNLVYLETIFVHFLRYIRKKSGISLWVHRLPFTSLDSSVFFVLLRDDCNLEIGLNCSYYISLFLWFHR